MRIDKEFHHAVAGKVPDVVVRAFKHARGLNEIKPIERGGTHIAGFLAELIAEHCYGMKPAPRGTKGYDAIARNGDRVQVKGFSHKKRGPAFRPNGKRLSSLFDRVLVLHITEHGWRVRCNRTSESIEALVIPGAYGSVRLQNYYLH
jgi:hypothetical protein